MKQIHLSSYSSFPLPSSLPPFFPPHSFVKAELARKKQEYDAQLKARISASVAGTNPADSVPPLDSLPYISYLDETGKINDSGADAKVKASVYAVYDESRTVKYIGVSRSVAQSLRLNLARQPEQTYGFRVSHITKPSRVLLEITRDTWIEQLGYKPEVSPPSLPPSLPPPSLLVYVCEEIDVWLSSV